MNSDDTKAMVTPESSRVCSLGRRRRQGQRNGDAAGKLRGFVAENQMGWPQYLDTSRQVTHQAFGVESFPTYVVVDHEGVIVYRRSGWSERIGAEVSSEVGKAIRAAKKASK